MKWKLNAAELLIPNTLRTSGAFHSTDMILGLSPFTLASQSISKLLEIAINTSAQAAHTQAHSQWFRPAPVGGGLVSLSDGAFWSRLEAAGMYSHTHAHC